MTEVANAFRIVLADDHPIVLAGLTRLIETDAQWHIAASCASGTAALQAIRELRPGIAVLDVSMPGLTGLEVLGHVKAENLSTSIVLLTASVRDEEILSAVDGGASAILLKDSAADGLLACLRAVAAGNAWMPDAPIRQAIARERERQRSANRVVGLLTPREREMVSLTMEGLSNKEIARKLGLAEGTVKIHLYNIYQKLGVSNRTALTALAHTHRDRFI
jgi:two-component system, NarL family, nitrate/nitrite response regulator NarL